MSDQLDTEETQEDVLAGAPAEEEEVSEQETDSETEESDTSEETGEDQGVDDGEDDKGEANNGYVEITDPKVKARMGQVTREKYEALRRAERLEKEFEEFKRKHEPVIEEVSAPDPDLAVDDPKEFTKQQQAYVNYIKESEARRIQDEQKQQQAKAQKQEDIKERINTYVSRAKKRGIDAEVLAKAGNDVGQYIPEDLGYSLLDDEDGAAITVHLYENSEDLHDLLDAAKQSPYRAGQVIERMRGKLKAAQKPKSPPKPPTKVTGTRKSDTNAGSGWSIS